MQCGFIFFSTLVGFSRQSIQYICISVFVCFCFTLFCFCCCFFLLISYRSTNRVKISTNPRIQACLVLFSFIFFLFHSNSAFFFCLKKLFLMTIDRGHGDEFALRSHASISFKFNLQIPRPRHPNTEYTK